MKKTIEAYQLSLSIFQLKLFFVIWLPLCTKGNELTHLPLEKMATILAEDIFRRSFVNEKFCILIKNSLKFVPKVPINNNPVLV